MESYDVEPKRWPHAWRAGAAGALVLLLSSAEPISALANAAPAKAHSHSEVDSPISDTGIGPELLAQAKPAPQRGQGTRGVKLGEISFRIPGGYLDRGSDFGNKKNPVIPLQALLPDLRPRAEGQGSCAPNANACPDFAVIKVRPLKAALESDFTRRYKTGPAGIGALPAAHGLRQVPPNKAQPADGRQFIAQPDGRWIWITCREFGRPAPKRPVRGVCRLAFDTADGLAVSVRFDKKHLPNWAAIHAKTIALVAELKE